MQVAGPKTEIMYWCSIILTSKGTTFVHLFKIDGALAGMPVGSDIRAAD
jgi:hypothetical protein